jgi:hypothetical protein
MMVDLVIQRFFVGNLSEFKERGWELGAMMVFKSLFNDLTTRSRSSEGRDIRRDIFGREVCNTKEQLKFDGTNGVLRSGVNISELERFGELFVDGRGMGWVIVGVVAWDFESGQV